jgi:hypothetical protein
MNVLFGASFQKKPATIRAERQNSAFDMPRPAGWGPGERPTGEAGDYKVNNLLTGEKYPLAAEVLEQKYEPVAGQQDTFKTREDKPVILEGRLPNPGETTINTHEGPVPAFLENGTPKVVLTDAGGEFPLALDKLTTFYDPIDADAKKLVEQVRQWIVKPTF